MQSAVLLLQLRHRRCQLLLDTLTLVVPFNLQFLQVGGGHTPTVSFISCWISCTYSGTPLLWTLWGLCEVSCVERCLHFRGKKSIFGTEKSVRGVLFEGFHQILVSGHFLTRHVQKSSKLHHLGSSTTILFCIVHVGG